MLTVNTGSGTPGGVYPLTITATGGTLSHTASASLTVNASLGMPIRVNAGGGQYTDSLGQVWLADTGYQQGSSGSTATTVGGTSDPTLYRTERFSTTGALSYQFGAPNGSYTVKLKFVETSYTAAGQRIFDVALNGSVVRPRLDILAAAGGANIAYDFSQPVAVTDGQITITLMARTGNPKINAIEIVYGTPAFAPIRVNAGGGAYTDSLGRAWSADWGYQQGASFSTVYPIALTPDPTLYQTEHYSSTGTLTYQFAVSNGDHFVSLKFAELWYSSPGQRVFNINVNGMAIGGPFDIFAAAHGANVAADMAVWVHVTDGQVTITLTAVTGNPKVNAIEID
jgi:hypothetical protein